jgi:hypothetical protein
MTHKPAYVVQDHVRPEQFTVRRITYRRRHDAKAKAQRPKVSIKVHRGMGRYWRIFRAWSKCQYGDSIPHVPSRYPGRWS